MEDIKEIKYNISFVLCETGRDIFTEASKKFKVGQHTTCNELIEFASNDALVIEISESTATDTPKIILSDNKNRCHLIALGIK